MCHFTPGEALAIAPHDSLSRLKSDWRLPGEPRLSAILYSGSGRSSVFDQFGILHVVQIPDGREIEVVSHLSARLGPEIQAGNAVVDLNTSFTYSQMTDTPPFGSFTRPSELVVKRLQSVASNIPLSLCSKRDVVAILDSGINPSAVRPQRKLLAEDFSRDAPQKLFDDRNDGDARCSPDGISGKSCRSWDHDGHDHGTKVCAILDASLPDDVCIASAKLSNENEKPTALRVARAFAQLVTDYSPSVVNLSITQESGGLPCPNGLHTAPVPSFYSQIVGFALKLAAPKTLSVMAAGNDGKPFQSVFFHQLENAPIFAVAQNSLGQRAAYSNFFVLNDATVIQAFGGDSGEQSDGVGIFVDDRDTVGTSFAAPFVTASVFLANAVSRIKHVERSNTLMRITLARAILEGVEVKRDGEEPSVEREKEMSVSELTPECLRIGDVCLPFKYD